MDDDRPKTADQMSVKGGKIMLFCLQNVSLIYDIEKEAPTYALKQVNLEIKEHTFYGILGPSGSGKSSLLYLMSGIKKPTNGKVYYEEQDLYEMKESYCSKLRLEKFGFIFQKHLLVPYLDLLENVLVPINDYKETDKQYALELLVRLGLEKEIHKKPNQLSGGQCQRVAIARALINHPKVIFADEMTASLDYQSAENVLDLFDTLRGESTILFVTHDERMVKGADEWIRLCDGKLETEYEA